MIIVTAGRPYLDIDAYAGCVAYQQLLTLQGQNAVFVSTSQPNYSVPEKYLQRIENELPSDVERTELQYIIVDNSDVSRFEAFVQTEQILEIIDHHPGKETYWAALPRVKVQIEEVGSSCTQIYEKWAQSQQVNQMPRTTAELLLCGILDNTLNFKAKITAKRDTDAYQKLCAQFELDQQRFARDYFTEIQSKIQDDLVANVLNDTKKLVFTTLDSVKPLTIGQLTIWDKNELTEESLERLKNTYPNDTSWLINILDIASGTSTFLCSDAEIRRWISELLDLSDDIDLHANRLWLRKEIMGADIIKGRQLANSAA